MASEVFMGLSFLVIKSSLIVYMFQVELYIRLTPNLFIPKMPPLPHPAIGILEQARGGFTPCRLDGSAPSVLKPASAQKRIQT